MRGKVILIAGLPGSGKSKYIERLAREANSIAFDDFKERAIDDNSAFNYSRHFASLVKGLAACGSFVLADVDFCKSESRQEAESCLRSLATPPEVEWRFFANEPEVCRRNVAERASVTPRDVKREMNLISQYSSKYVIPAGALVIPVWRKA